MNRKLWANEEKVAIVMGILRGDEPAVVMKRRMVEELMAEGKSLKVALEVVGMAKSSYYYQPIEQKKPRALDESLVRSINKVRQGYAGVYGYRKVTMALRA